MLGTALDNQDRSFAVHELSKKKVKLSAIKKNPDNPRIIRDEKFARLKKSLKEFPQMIALRPIVVDSDGVILGGNMRFEALKANGLKDIPDEWVKRADDLTEEQKQEFIIKDNAGFGEWDWDCLANEWSDLPLSDWGVDIPEDWAPADPVQEDESAVGQMIDKAAELQKKWHTKTGQLWEIPSNSAQGKSHRLLVGDSTNKANVGRLLGKQRASLVFTDPPYGVDYDGGTTKREKLAGDDTTALYDPACLMAFEFSDDESPLYLWHAGVKGIAAAAAAAAAAAGYVIRCELVWNKNQAQFGALSAQYKQKHEPCYYCVKKKKPPRWYGPTNEVTVWDVDRASVNEFHPTQKPTELAQRAMRNSTISGDLVLDLFLGSGATMVAAEHEARLCYGVEMSVDYCAVILERLSALGLTPKLRK